MNEIVRNDVRTAIFVIEQFVPIPGCDRGGEVGTGTAWRLTWKLARGGLGDSVTRGLGDSGTRGLGDSGTRGLGDSTTRGLGDSGTRGLENSGTRGLGDSGNWKTKATGAGTRGRWTKGLEDVTNSTWFSPSLSSSRSLWVSVCTF